MTKPNYVKMLYVDDESMNLRVFKAHFSKVYELLTAPNGELGLATLLMNPDINIVFSDFQMPGMNGVEFIRKAKQIQPGIKCFLLTCSNLTPEIQAALDSQLVLKLFRKPYVKEHIIKTLNETVI